MSAPLQTERLGVIACGARPEWAQQARDKPPGRPARSTLPTPQASGDSDGGGATTYEYACAFTGLPLASCAWLYACEGPTVGSRSGRPNAQNLDSPNVVKPDYRSPSSMPIRAAWTSIRSTRPESTSLFSSTRNERSAAAARCCTDVSITSTSALHSTATTSRSSTGSKSSSASSRSTAATCTGGSTRSGQNWGCRLSRKDATSRTSPDRAAPGQERTGEGRHQVTRCTYPRCCATALRASDRRRRLRRADREAARAEHAGGDQRGRRPRLEPEP